MRADIGAISLDPGPLVWMSRFAWPGSPRGGLGSDPTPFVCPGLCQRVLVPNISPAAGELRILVVEQACGCLIHPRPLVKHFCPKKEIPKPGLGTAVERDALHQHRGAGCVTINLTLAVEMGLPVHPLIPML